MKWYSLIIFGQFNISIDRVLSFLNEKGVEGMNPSSKVPENIYMDLLCNFRDLWCNYRDLKRPRSTSYLSCSYGARLCLSRLL